MGCGCNYSGGTYRNATGPYQGPDDLTTYRSGQVGSMRVQAMRPPTNMVVTSVERSAARPPVFIGYPHMKAQNDPWYTTLQGRSAINTSALQSSARQGGPPLPYRPPFRSSPPAGVSGHMAFRKGSRPTGDVDDTLYRNAGGDPWYTTLQGRSPINTSALRSNPRYLGQRDMYSRSGGVPVVPGFPTDYGRTAMGGPWIPGRPDFGRSSMSPEIPPGHMNFRRGMRPPWGWPLRGKGLTG